MPHYEGDLRATHADRKHAGREQVGRKHADDGQGARFAILASRWNPGITDALVVGARKAFADHGVADAMIDVIRVPGAWELPLAAARIAAVAAGPAAELVEFYGDTGPEIFDRTLLDTLRTVDAAPHVESQIHLIEIAVKGNGNS